MKKTMVRFLVYGLMLVAVAGLLLAACDSPTSTADHCDDPDYPLWCSDPGVCCPRGYPVYCGGKCYSTESSARAVCDGLLDTCTE